MSAPLFNTYSPVGPNEEAEGTVEGPIQSKLAATSKKRLPKAKGRRASGTGSIYQEASGGYRVKFATGDIDPINGSPKYVKRRAKTHEEAVRILNGLTTAQGMGNLRPASNHTVVGYLKYWVAKVVRSTKSPRTADGYESTIKLFIEPSLLVRKKIQDLKSTDIQSLLNSVAITPIPRLKETPREGETYSRRQVEIIRNVIRAGLNHAMNVDRIISYNPAIGVSLPRTARKPKPKGSITRSDLERLVDVLRENRTYGPVILFMLATGTRVGEAIGVRWQDIDFNTGRVLIRGQLHREKTHGMVYSSETKSGQARAVSLPESMITILKNLAASNMRGERDKDPDGIVFLNSSGGRMDSSGITRRLKGICRQAKVASLSPHILRHTVATLWLEASGDLHGTAKLLGHAQVALTADLYGHILEGRSKKMSSILEDCVFGNESANSPSKRH